MTDLKSSISEIAHDLFNLEINTIIDENITAVKMPAPRHALIDIAKDYVRFLLTLDLNCQLSQSEPPGSYASFKKIGGLVHELLAENKIRLSEGTLSYEERAQLALIDRINTKCAQMAAMMLEWQQRNYPGWDNSMNRDDVAAAEPLKLPPRETMLIRKTWELGTSEIAMQTVVQLDGDVVTRINPRYAQSGWSGLHRVHHKGLNVSLSMWGELVRILETIMNKGKSLMGMV